MYGLYRVGLEVKESICRKSVYTHQFIDKQLMSMLFELAGKCGAANFAVAYAPSDCIKNAGLKHSFLQKLGDLVEHIPSKQCLY